MEALLQGRVAKYAPILRSSNENNSNVQKDIFLLQILRECTVFLLQTYRQKTCAALPAKLYLGVFSGFAKEACPWGLRSVCILTVLLQLPVTSPPHSFRISVFLISFATQISGELENQKPLWVFLRVDPFSDLQISKVGTHCYTSPSLQASL